MQKAPASIRIEPAQKSQAPLILYFIKQLAEYERLLDEVTADEARIEQSLFGEKSCAEVSIAQFERQSASGVRDFLSTDSTFVGQPGIYLEDLFVEPKFRGFGVGKALLVHLAKLVRERGGRAWNGRYSIGMSLPSSFTRAWAQQPKMNGLCTA